MELASDTYKDFSCRREVSFTGHILQVTTEGHCFVDS